MSNASLTTKNERVIAYIDGFNLYFGLIEGGYDYCKWLNIKKLVLRLLKPNQELIAVKYFTSRIGNDPDKQKRQNVYIEAIETTGTTIQYGKFEEKPVECKRCGNIWKASHEKMTDVNIATRLIIDAYKDLYDMAMLISGDSDLIPPIRAIHELFPLKRVFIAFPPKRHNYSMEQVAKGSEIIGRKKLIESQFEDEIVKPDGFVLRKPAKWL